MKTERFRDELYFDIETIPDQSPDAIADIAATLQPPGNISKADTIAAWHAEKKPLMAEEQWRKTSFNGGRGQIATISYALNDDAPVALYSDNWKDDEAEIVRSFYDVLAKAGSKASPRLIGFNIVNFDLRFLFQRSVVLGIRPPMWVPFNAKPWDTDAVFDVMTAWAGARGMESMEAVCKATGVRGKGTLDGSQVWDYVDAGRISEVAAYCNDDVIRTRDLHYRVEFRAPLAMAA